MSIRSGASNDWKWWEADGSILLGTSGPYWAGSCRAVPCNRRNIIAAGLTFWSLMTACTGAISNIWQLAVVRLLMGAGEAYGIAPSNSIIADRFPPDRGRWHWRSSAPPRRFPISAMLRAGTAASPRPWGLVKRCYRGERNLDLERFFKDYF